MVNPAAISGTKSAKQIIPLLVNMSQNCETKGTKQYVTLLSNLKHSSADKMFLTTDLLQSSNIREEKQNKTSTSPCGSAIHFLPFLFLLFGFRVDNWHWRVSRHNRTMGYCQAMVKRGKADVRLRCVPVYCAREGKNDSGGGRNYSCFHKRWAIASQNYGKIQLKHSN